ncbi:tryptophan synthase beta subunit-like PLP-dependent enzyme [Xylariomycetidae sp. FL2044]|nr:tryptophan synthase beta subunit-like PLP-dependent enzyme [Xylariomycetidae sp. FL2044]
MAEEQVRVLYVNPSARHWRNPSPPPTGLVNAFHRGMTGYSATKLFGLDKVAEDVGVKSVYLKFEGHRLGLASFKILGASWGTLRAVIQKYGLPAETADLDVAKEALRKNPTTLVAATDGNHGLAVARMGNLLDTKVDIFVPKGLHPATIQNLRDEGASVTVTEGSYDDAVQLASNQAKRVDGILIQDTAFPGYEEIPGWIVQGYDTMLHEVDEQLDHTVPDLVIAPVGVGSFAQSVVAHYKAPKHACAVLTVEPDTAACLHTSLRAGECVPIETTPTIMAGLDCGTVSSIAWPLLKAGVDASLTVSDYESHDACLYLTTLDIQAGPCGGASLAALRRLTSSDKAALGLDQSSTVVLLCTEGFRKYEAPDQPPIEQAQLAT